MILIMIVIKIVKYTEISRTLSTTNAELPVTLYNGQKPLTNITKISTSDAAWDLYASLNRIIHHLT